MHIYVIFFLSKTNFKLLRFPKQSYFITGLKYTLQIPGDRCF